MQKINWKGTIDDFTARYKGYLLRIEQMDTNMWWWRITKGESIETESVASSLDEAKRLIKEYILYDE